MIRSYSEILEYQLFEFNPGWISLKTDYNALLIWLCVNKNNCFKEGDGWVGSWWLAVVLVHVSRKDLTG